MHDNRPIKRIGALILSLAMMTGMSGCKDNAADPAGDVVPAPVPEAVSEAVIKDDEALGLSENKAEEDSSVSADEAVIQEEPVNEYADKHIRLTVTDPGTDVFTPSTTCLPDYRYGPSMILNDDGSIDAWFSAPGDGSREFDWISYRHSDDGGTTWSDEKVAISPSPDSPDALSTCDPDVFY